MNDTEVEERVAAHTVATSGIPSAFKVRFGHLEANPANLFGLLVGGPAVELQIDDQYSMVIVETSANEPFALPPPRRRTINTGLGLSSVPAEQAARFAAACRKYAAAIPAIPARANVAADDSTHGGGTTNYFRRSAPSGMLASRGKTPGLTTMLVCSGSPTYCPDKIRLYRR